MTELSVFHWQGANNLDGEAMREALLRDGAILVRDMLSPQEIETARQQLRNRLTTGGERIQLGKTQPNAALIVPEIGWLVGHESIISVMRTLLDEDICFTGHCDIHMNMLSGWHKDSGESVGGYFKGDYFAAPDCHVYKAAAYLQDATSKDGLTVRLGSHRHRSNDGVTAHVPAKAGDVVFFDVRLSHVGQLPDPFEKMIKVASRLTQKRNRIDPSWATALKDVYWKAIGRRDRLSVFFTYGKRNAFTTDFAESNMQRQNDQTEAETTQIVMPAPLTAALQKSGIEMVQFTETASTTTSNAKEPA